MRKRWRTRKGGRDRGQEREDERGRVREGWRTREGRQERVDNKGRED